MTKPKICQWCHHYSGDTHRCKKTNHPRCNVNTCSTWTPLINLAVISGVEFVEYDQYNVDYDVTNPFIGIGEDI